MTWYSVTVSTYMPYKREYSYRMKGSSEHIAVARAIKLFRKEPMIKGRRIQELTIQLVRIGKVDNAQV